MKLKSVFKTNLSLSRGYIWEYYGGTGDRSISNVTDSMETRGHEFSHQRTHLKARYLQAHSCNPRSGEVGLSDRAGYQMCQRHTTEKPCQLRSLLATTWKSHVFWQIYASSCVCLHVHTYIPQIHTHHSTHTRIYVCLCANPDSYHWEGSP